MAVQRWLLYPGMTFLGIILWLGTWHPVGCSESNSTETPLPEIAKQIQGTWRRAGDGPTEVLKIESKRIVSLESNQLAISGITYKDGKQELMTFGMTEDVEFAVKSNQLTLKKNDGIRTYEKIDQTPAGMDIKPLNLGSRIPTSNEIADIKKQLRERQLKDQMVRKSTTSGLNMAEVDRENTLYVCNQVSQFGWIDATRFGKEAADDAFLLVQHSMHLPLMMTALPEVEKDVKAQLVDGQNFALLFDRVNLMLGLKQRFGSQFFFDESKTLVFFPLLDYVKVNDDRKAIGIFPFEKYVEMIQQMHGDCEVKFLGVE